MVLNVTVSKNFVFRQVHSLQTMREYKQETHLKMNSARMILGTHSITSQAVLAFEANDLTLSYGFQHISNARIYNHNLGLNLHLVGGGFQL